MADIPKLAKEQIRKLSPCSHGGNVWKVAQEHGIPLSEIIDFSVSMNPLGTSRKAMQSIRGHIEVVENYPPPNAEPLTNKLATYAGARKENIIVGNGTTELIHTFVDVFLEKNQKALIPVPTFGEYNIATLKTGGQPVFLKCSSETNFALNLEKLNASVSDDIKVVFLCNPNSPTGTLLKRKSILDFTRKLDDRNILVFLDEAYFEFVEDGKRYSMAEHVNGCSNLFVLRSLTKFFGLAGLRIGFGVASPGMIELLRKAQVPWSVNSLAIFAAEAAIKDIAFIEKSKIFTLRSKKQLQKLLQEIRWLKVYPSEANFFLCEIKAPNLTSTKLKEELEQKGVLIRDCSNFEGLNNRFFRVAVKTPQENRKLAKLLNVFI